MLAFGVHATFSDSSSNVTNLGVDPKAAPLPFGSSRPELPKNPSMPDNPPADCPKLVGANDSRSMKLPLRSVAVFHCCVRSVASEVSRGGFAPDCTAALLSLDISLKFTTHQCRLGGGRIILVDDLAERKTLLGRYGIVSLTCAWCGVRFVGRCARMLTLLCGENT